MSMQDQNIDNSLPPHGLRDLIPYKFFWEDLWPKALVVLGILLLLFILYKLGKKFFKRAPKVVIPEDPFLVLERKLSKMLPPEPFEGKPSTQYFFDLNMIFRQFLELCLKIPATDLTLQELKEPLRFKSPLSREVTEDILKFLERSEYIKYAGFETNLDEAKECHLQVIKWVSYIRPRRLEESSKDQSVMNLMKEGV